MFHSGLGSSILERLLYELATTDGIMFVISSEGIVFEMHSSSDTPPTFGGEWAELRGKDWHAHLNLRSVEEVQFVEQEDHGTVPVLYYTRFSDDKGDTVFRAYFPNPYLDANEKLTNFQPEKLELFKDFKDRYSGQKGIAFVKRPRQQ